MVDEYTSVLLVLSYGLYRIFTRTMMPSSGATGPETQG
jgi:hypothetical protein